MISIYCHVHRHDMNISRTGPLHDHGAGDWRVRRGGAPCCRSRRCALAVTASASGPKNGNEKE